MKAHGRPSKHARHPCRGRRPQARAEVRRVHWIGQMVIGVAPRAWLIEAANDPKA